MTWSEESLAFKKKKKNLLGEREAALIRIATMGCKWKERIGECQGSK